MNKAQKFLAIEWCVFVPMSLVGIITDNQILTTIAFLGALACVIGFFKYRGGSR